MTADNQIDRHCYSFGPYVVDAGKRLLWRDRALVPITSKAFEILLLLIQRRGRVVEKQELLEEIWRRTAVEENTLTRHISTLRKILEERPDHHEYMLTIPGHGYQFVAEVTELDRRPDNLQHTVAGARGLDGTAPKTPIDSGAMAIAPPRVLEPVPVNSPPATAGGEHVLLGRRGRRPVPRGRHDGAGLCRVARRRARGVRSVAQPPPVDLPWRAADRSDVVTRRKAGRLCVGPWRPRHGYLRAGQSAPRPPVS